jgi:hypothetical protein
MAKQYFTLVIFENGSWAPQFGDYVRSVVQDERDDYREHDVLLKHMKIIKTTDDQASIDSAVAQLNNVPHPGHFGACLVVFNYIDLHEKCLAHTPPVVFPAKTTETGVDLFYFTEDDEMDSLWMTRGDVSDPSYCVWIVPGTTVSVIDRMD